MSEKENKVTVNVMGTDYQVYFDSTDPRLNLSNADGFTDNTTHEIHIAKFEDCPNSVKDLKSYAKKVLYHELVHAFLYQSGLAASSDWAENEEIVDWFTLQHNKISNAFDSVSEKSQREWTIIKNG